MNVIERFKNYRNIIFIIILPILCFITRKISYPFYSSPFFELNDNSFFGNVELKIKNNPLEEWTYKLEYYNNTRLFFEAKYNKIILYFTFSDNKYYDDYYLSFVINLNINESLLNISNNSIFYSEDFNNTFVPIKITNNNIDIINKYFLSIKKRVIFILNKINFDFNKNNSNIKTELFFDDFDLIINLRKEKLTYKFFYLLQYFIISGINNIIFATYFWENNFQNINFLFIFVILAKINSENLNIIDLFKVSFPLIKIITFYPHLLIYGEFILSISDLVTIIVLIWMASLIIIFVFLSFELYINYYHCFNNKIVNNRIVIKNTNNIIKSKFIIFFLFLISFNIIFDSLFIQIITLILTIILTIYKHLTQREVMYQRDIDFSKFFYSLGVGIYFYHLLIHYFGKYYRIKPLYSSSFPFLSILLLILFLILIKVIEKQYKFVYIMKKDFEKLKILDKESCAICLKDFIYNKDKVDKIFCKVTQDENIHETLCNHYFHEKCLFNWRKYRNICPVCRKPLKIPNYHHFYDETPCIYKPSWL